MNVHFLICNRTVVRLGELNLDPMIDDGALPLDVPIKHIINHEGYDSKKNHQ